MSYSYLTNILISKQVISLKNGAKLFKNGHHNYGKNNPLREQSSSSSRIVPQFSQSVVLDKNVHDETTKSIDSKRNFSTSSATLSNSSKPNTNKERKLNYIVAIGFLFYSTIGFYLNYVLFQSDDKVHIEQKE